MKLILRENVVGLGKIGDVVTVADGYGRNFLLPRRLALLANARNVHQMQHNKQVAAIRLEKAKSYADTLRNRLDNLTFEVSKYAGEEGKLFGSVTTRELADLLADRGFEIDRRDISLSEPIKSVGEYQVTVKLHEGVHASITVVVQANETEAAVAES
jgi:large subunit ribosomal protein L9